MRIVLLGINYAPERTGIAPYTTALARHLAREHDVTVIAGMPHYPEWQVPENYRRWRTDSVEDGVRVIRVRHYVPSRQSVTRRLAYELTWAARAAAVGARLQADVVIAVVPALFAAQIARVVARRTGASSGVLVQDVMGTAARQSGLRSTKVLKDLIASVERSGLGAASAVATIHPRLATELQQIGGRTEQPSVIYNWTHTRHRPRTGAQLRRQFGWGDDEVVALHSGNMGLKQNLEVVIDAARLAQERQCNVRFVLAGDGSQRQALHTYAADCANVSFISTVPDEQYMDLLAAADVLLVNERPGVREMSLPSKLTSYLVAGRPIVAAADSSGATAEFVLASGGGLLTPAGNAERLLDTTMKLAADTTLTQLLVQQGTEFAQENLAEDGALAAYDQWLEHLASLRPAS